ncbi:M48 family metalloprotease [Micavibrio aeruginosavorus]|uniref:M48 family metalloprotease n=1 Tax=Micavibrio aeruginosavorus TaxID=349221 RepID=UPI003F4AEF7E
MSENPANPVLHLPTTRTRLLRGAGMVLAQFGVPTGLAMAAAVTFGFGPSVGLGMIALAYGSGLIRALRTEDDRSFDRAHEKAPIVGTLQTIMDSLAFKAGMAPLPVRFIRDDDYASLNTIGQYAATTGQAVYASSQVAALPRREQAFTLAHEIAHVRARDVRTQIPIRMAIHGSLVLTGVAGVAMMGAVLFTGGSVTAAFLGMSWMGSFYAHHIVQKALGAKIIREQEYRADANALRLTRDFNAAVSLIDRLDDTGPGGIYEDDEPAPTVTVILEKVFGEHPVRDDRVKSLRAVWKDMVAADPSLQTPRVVPPVSAPRP